MYRGFDRFNCRARAFTLRYENERRFRLIGRGQNETYQPILPADHWDWILNEISTARAECVRRPTDIRSTPASAYARTRSRSIPPEASIRTFGFKVRDISTSFAASSGDWLSRRIMSAPA